MYGESGHKCRICGSNMEWVENIPTPTTSSEASGEVHVTSTIDGSLYNQSIASGSSYCVDDSGYDGSAGRYLKGAKQTYRCPKCRNEIDVLINY